MPPRLNEEEEEQLALAFDDNDHVVSSCLLLPSSVTHATTTTTPNKPSNDSTTTRSVTFCDSTMNETLTVLHLDDYSKQEIHDTWYTNSEVVNIRKEAKKKKLVIIDDYDNNYWESDHNTCCTSYRKKQQQQQYNRDTTRKLVLTEQDRQRVMEDYDPDYISLLYKTNQYHRRSIQTAIEIGMKDAYESAKFLLKN